MKILGYKFISLDELERRISKPRLDRVAVITFDDGFKDLYQNAYPILKELKIPFTLFLITSTIESKSLLWLHKLYISIEELPPMEKESILKKYSNLQYSNMDLIKSVSNIIMSNDKKIIENLTSSVADVAELSKEKERLIAEKLYLTKAELFEMKKHGLKIEAHGHEHWPLTSLNRTETENEIRSSVEYIMETFYKKPRFYCLPYGGGNQFVEDIVKDIELIGIATTKPKLVNAFEDSYSLPRICVLNDILYFHHMLNQSYLKALLEQIHL